MASLSKIIASGETLAEEEALRWASQLLTAKTRGLVVVQAGLTRPRTQLNAIYVESQVQDSPWDASSVPGSESLA